MIENIVRLAGSVIKEIGHASFHIHVRNELVVSIAGVATIPETLVAALRAARHVAALTGAGISAESGIPTFREAQTGLWARYDPEELASPEAFRRHPQLVWEWYQWRRELVRGAAPNAGHLALAQIASLAPQFTLITQNVDGLHQRAGSANVIELHGNIMRNRCFQEDIVVSTPVKPGQTPPLCPRCGGFLRPDVVWFGEALPLPALTLAFKAAASCDLFLSVGTSALVHPAAALPREALAHEIMTVEINPSSTPLTPYVDYVLSGSAGEILPALLRATWPEANAIQP